MSETQKFSEDPAILLEGLIKKYAYLKEEDNATAHRVYQIILAKQPKK